MPRVPFHYLRHFWRALVPDYIIGMSTGISRKFRCAQCEQLETECQCEKYCCFCQAITDIRMCDDGLMYCEPCRKACDYKTSDDV